MNCRHRGCLNMFSRALLSWLRGIQVFVSFSMRSHALNAMGRTLRKRGDLRAHNLFHDDCPLLPMKFVPNLHEAERTVETLCRDRGGDAQPFDTTAPGL